MTPDHPARKVMEPEKVTHLIRIPRGQDYAVSSFLERLNDWQEKGDVGRIVQVDPDLFRPRDAHRISNSLCCGIRAGLSQVQCRRGRRNRNRCGLACRTNGGKLCDGFYDSTLV